MNPELLQKYIAGNATEAEKQRVTEWIQENPENMREYMAQRKLHDMALWRTEPGVSGVGGCELFSAPVPGQAGASLGTESSEDSGNRGRWV